MIHINYTTQVDFLFLFCFQSTRKQTTFIIIIIHVKRSRLVFNQHKLTIKV